MKHILDEVKQRFAILNKRMILGFLVCPGVFLGGCKPAHQAQESVATVSGTFERIRMDGPYSGGVPGSKPKGEKACCAPPPNRAAMMRDANPPPAP
jgi:hypothetical protein